MSRRRKQRDNFVQSLFPFLAVLLSTMGALVLLLMLIVNQAQASAKQMAAEKKIQIEDAESNLQLLRNSFEEQLDDRRLELERKRLTLQHLEKHIQELMEELKGIERTAVLLGQKQTKDKTAEVQTERKISLLEKQLADAQIDLKKKLDKPEGDKPIFAIIPYQGTNGTHRRPIYLECTNQGVTIQPEGVLIGLADLRPPYGPGNPLDAAIRTVRSRFIPANGALTSTAYPLLIVRPSGVRTYAMARQAMAGWDDQFGYELIDESLELTYPESEPGIVGEIEQALVLARERQAALVMAMPAKYRQYINQAGSSSDALEFGDDAGDMGDEWAGGSLSGGTGNRFSSNAGGSGSSSSSGYRGGFDSQGGANAQRDGAGGRGNGQRNGATGKAGSQQSGPQQLGSQNLGSQNLGSQNLGFGGNLSNHTQPEGTSYFADGNNKPQADGNHFGANTGGPQSFGSQVADSQIGSLQSRDGSPFSGDYSAGNNGGNAGFADTSSRNGAGNSSEGGNGASNGSASGSGSRGPMGQRVGSGSASGGASGVGAASMGSAANAAQTSSSQDPTARPGDPVQAGGAPSVNMDMSRNVQGQRDSQTVPVASQRGRNWAWNEGPPSKTPVVRSIRVVCYSDRWVLMQDNAATSNQVTVPIGQSPQASAERLASAITDRVAGWGIALGDGYWKPELVVDVARGAEGRYSQLERLLEGSGLSVKRRATVK